MTEKTQRNLAIVVCFLVAGILVPVIYAIGNARYEKRVSEIRIPPHLTESQEDSRSSTTTDEQPIVESQSPMIEEESPQEDPTVEEAVITGRLINTITNEPMPGIPVVAARSSSVYTVTRIDGSFVLNIPKETVMQDTFELYGFGGLFFEETDMLTAEIGDDVTLYLTPKDPPAGMTVTFPDVEYTPTDGDSPIVRGRVVDAQTGKPIADLRVNFFGESFGGRTDEDGFFWVYTLIGGVHRMYFMGDDAVDDPQHLYQVISVKGYEGALIFSL